MLYKQFFNQYAKRNPGRLLILIGLSHNVIIVIEGGEQRRKPICVITYNTGGSFIKRVFKRLTAKNYIEHKFTFNIRINPFEFYRIILINPKISEYGIYSCNCVNQVCSGLTLKGQEFFYIENIVFCNVI